jgi:AcrR family transcriptional regulator
MAKGECMPKQENEHTKTRERILAIACEVFAKRGFRKTTVRDICQQAGVNVASINYYFSSKEKLYEEVCKYACGISSDDSDQRFKLNTSGKPEEQLKSFVQALLTNVLGKEPSSWRHLIMSREMVEPTNALSIIIKEMIKPRFQQLFAIVQKLLGNNVSEETVRRCCFSITGQCLYYRFAQPVVLKLSPQQKYDPASIEKLAEHITRFSLNALKQFALTQRERT